ncbi:MAG TPA: cytochrome P450 [Candidatus Limnocylindrales bacterium]
MSVDARLFSLQPEFFDPAAPVHFDERTQAFSLFGYDDVVRLLTDRTGFSSGLGFDPAELPRMHPAYSGMWLTDGKRHDELRAAVADPFRPSYLATLEPRIREIAVDLIDKTPAAGPHDLADLFRMLPSMVMCLILDVELDAAHRMLGWINETAEVTSIMGFPPQTDMADYFREVIARHRAQPSQGLLAELIAAQDAGAPLTEWDLIGYVTMLLIAGIDTTGAVIGNCMLFLTEYGHTGQLAAEPELIPAAVEEVTRWYPPFPAATRLAIAPVTFSGVQIPPYTPVAGYLSAANRDPVRFPDPHRFDIGRNPNPHLSFGRGPRYCLGAPLARLETVIAVQEMLARRPGLSWDSGVPLERHQGIIHRLTGAVFKMG